MLLYKFSISTLKLTFMIWKLLILIEGICKEQFYFNAHISDLFRAYQKRKVTCNLCKQTYALFISLKLNFCSLKQNQTTVFVGSFCLPSGVWVHTGQGPGCQGCAARFTLQYDGSTFRKDLSTKSRTWFFCVLKGLAFVFNTLKKKKSSFHFSKPYMFYLLIAQNVSTISFYIKPIFILA